jgi:acyl carrier protein
MKINYYNRQLFESLAKEIGADYNPKIGAEVVSAVHETLIDSLGVEDDEILPGATLLEKLGAESIDGLDIMFRLERHLGIKASRDDSFGTLIDLPENFSGDQVDALKYQKTVLSLAKQVYQRVVENSPQ